MRVKTEQSIAVHVVAAFVVIIASLFASRCQKNIFNLGSRLRQRTMIIAYDSRVLNVNNQATAVGSAPAPAPFAICPNNVIPETTDHTSQVYGWGVTRLLKASRKYGIFPYIAIIVAVIAVTSFMFTLYHCHFIKKRLSSRTISI